MRKNEIDMGRLPGLIAKKGLTQQQVGEAIGIGRDGVCYKLRQGSLKVTELPALADALDMGIDELMLALQPLQGSEESEERLAYLRRERFSDNPFIFLEQLYQRKDELEVLLSKVDGKKTGGRDR